MTAHGGRWEDDFPIRERYEDFSGKQRTFVITCYEVGLGVTVRATEEGRDGLGYEVAAFSESSPYSAVANGRYEMMHSEIPGRITANGEGGALLIVDGVALGLDELESFLSTHEGWEFCLRIVDALA